MSHNLTVRHSGLVEMAYVGQNPWHGLGFYLGDKAVTSKVIMERAGIDWSVELRDIYYSGKNDAGELIHVPLPDYVATVRADTQEALGIVGRDYKPIQQREAFDFTDELVGDAAAMYETAGSLHSGQEVWALVKLPHQLVVTGDDVLNQYLLFVNGHNGKKAFRCGFTTIRVVCDNTCSAALAQWERGITNIVSVRHTGDIKSKVEEARKILGISLKYFEVAGKVYRAMSQKQINDIMLQEYFRSVVPTPEDVEPGATDLRKAQVQLAQEKTKNVHVWLAQLFETGRGNHLPGARGTLWGAFNAVTEYVDHVRPAKKDGTARKGGFEAALFGEGERIKQRAFDEAVKFLK